MTVKDLIKKLEMLEQDKEIYIAYYTEWEGIESDIEDVCKTNKECYVICEENYRNLCIK